MSTPTRQEQDPNRAGAEARTPPLRQSQTEGMKDAERGSDRAGGRERTVPHTSGEPQPAPDTSKSPLANRNVEGPRQAGATPRPTDKPLGE